MWGWGGEGIEEEPTDRWSQRLTEAALQMSLGSSAGRATSPSTRCNTNRPSVVSSAGIQSGWRTYCPGQKRLLLRDLNMATSDPCKAPAGSTLRNTASRETRHQGAVRSLRPAWARCSPVPYPARPAPPAKVFHGESHCNCDRVQPLEAPNAPPSTSVAPISSSAAPQSSPSSSGPHPLGLRPPTLPEAPPLRPLPPPPAAIWGTRFLRPLLARFPNPHVEP